MDSIHGEPKQGNWGSLMGYIENRQWSDRFIPEMKRIIGPFLMETSSLTQDMMQATDLIILKARDFRVACRIRRPGFLKYANEFTIRSFVPSGVHTELAKIVDGFGDWMFYGHSDQTETRIERWMLIDLSAWRAHMIRRNKKQLVITIHDNSDGTKFHAFDVSSFPVCPSILIASSHTIPNQPNSGLIRGAA